MSFSFLFQISVLSKTEYVCFYKEHYGLFQNKSSNGSANRQLQLLINIKDQKLIWSYNFWSMFLVLYFSMIRKALNLFI